MRSGAECAQALHDDAERRVGARRVCVGLVPCTAPRDRHRRGEQPAWERRPHSWPSCGRRGEGGGAPECVAVEARAERAPRRGLRKASRGLLHGSTDKTARPTARRGRVVCNVRPRDRISRAQDWMRRGGAEVGEDRIFARPEHSCIQCPGRTQRADAGATQRKRRGERRLYYLLQSAM